jgi:NitT/TauT family transport system substrate-binding protein
MKRWLLSALLPVAIAASGISMAIPAKAEPFEIVHTTWVGYGPLYLARDLGYFKEEGIDVKLTTVEEKSLQMAAVMSGNVAGAAGTVDEFLLYMKEGTCLKYVLALDESSGGDGILARDEIKTIADLKGKKIAFNEGSVSQFWLNVILKENGMSQDDIEMVNMTADDAAAAFMANRVDVAVTWEPHLTEVRNAKQGHILIDSSKSPGVITDVITVSCDTAEKRKDEIKALVRGWNRAVEYWKAHPDEANAIMAKGVGGWLSDPASFADSAKGVRFFDAATNKSYFGTPGQPGDLYKIVDFAINIWGGLGKLQMTPKAEDFIADAFVNQ